MIPLLSSFLNPIANWKYVDLATSSERGSRDYRKEVQAIRPLFIES